MEPNPLQRLTQHLRVKTEILKELFLHTRLLGRWWDVQCISVNFRIILPLFYLGDVYQNWRNPPTLYYPPYFGPSPIILLFCSRGKSRFLTNFEKARKTLKPCVISVGFFKKSNFRGVFRAIELCPLGNVQFRPPWGTGFFSLWERRVCVKEFPSPPLEKRRGFPLLFGGGSCVGGGGGQKSGFSNFAPKRATSSFPQKWRDREIYKRWGIAKKTSPVLPILRQFQNFFCFCGKRLFSGKVLFDFWQRMCSECACKALFQTKEEFPLLLLLIRSAAERQMVSPLFFTAQKSLVGGRERRSVG